MNTTERSNRDDQAFRLAAAVSKLRTGLRDARWEVTDLSITQVAILRYLDEHESATAAVLASAEHISPQAVAQQLNGLKARDYVITELDPEDRRKSVIRLTDRGRDLLLAVLETREAWLAHAIEESVCADERADLERAIVILERLAVKVTTSSAG